MLGILSEEAAFLLGRGGHDQRAVVRLHNGPNKVRAVRCMMQLRCPDYERLRAIGGLRDCLHHCSGRIRGVRARTRLVPACMLFDIGQYFCPNSEEATLIVPRRAVENICLLYRKVGDELLAELGKWRRESLTLRD